MHVCVYVLIFRAGQRARGKTDPGEVRQRERKLVCFGNKPRQLRNPYVCRALAGPNLAVIPCFLNMHDKLQSCYRGPARLNAQPGRPTSGGSDWRTGLIKVGPTKINTLQSVLPFKPLENQLAIKTGLGAITAAALGHEINLLCAAATALFFFYPFSLRTVCDRNFFLFLYSFPQLGLATPFPFSHSPGD